MDNKDLKLNGDYYSVVANELIRHHQSMTLREMQLLQLVISNVVKGDDEFYVYTTNVTELSKFLGIRPQSLYRDLDEITDRLMKRIIKDNINGEIVKTHWVETCAYNPNTKKVTMRLSNDLKPYLLGLQRFYSQIDVNTLISFKTYYALRMYQIIVCEFGEKGKEEFYFSCDEIRTLFEIPKTRYKLNADLIRRTIKPALDELNSSEHCCIYDYQEIKATTKGNPLLGVKFGAIIFKKGTKETFMKYLQCADSDNKLEKEA